MTFHIISVGTSIAEKIQSQFGRGFDQRLSSTQIDNSSQGRSALKASPDQWLSRSSMTQLDTLEFSASAELSTFAAFYRQARAILEDGDTAYLLASDTPEGLKAAAWVAYYLTRNTSRIEYHDDVERFGSGPERGMVAIYRVPGLDASSQRLFEESMEAIGLLGARVFNRNRNPREPIRVHISGGYKASVPFLITLAEGLRSAARDVQAVCVSDRHPPPGQLPACITIPLRELDYAELSKVVSAFTHSSTRVDCNPSGLLAGYTHVKDPDGKWRLTPFGCGLVNLYRASGAANL